ncbi:uncharacterized protein LOC105445386 [Strongylocentrotus purpuratus]|uniref:Uncharacterized protein n=1 Tax=Strongylocentrotus purpuratus TaxID=7668 RepID=A0A7M7NDZ3_STRPU|nr:uncharacterized protein LOC105445386 [Strongylocentrotus purpuratus]
MDSESTTQIPRAKGVKVCVCSGSLSKNVEGLIQLIKHNMKDVVETVRYEPLPYNVSDMEKLDLSGIDVLLLCHSIENRRFSITNVTDALYDGFLQRAKNYLGQSKVGVIAHDFPEGDLSSEKLSSKMASFRYTQSTTFKCASLVLIGGQLAEDPVQLTRTQRDHLRQFFCAAASQSCLEIIQVMLYRFRLFITCGLT